jgi:hypothetical protein
MASALSLSNAACSTARVPIPPDAATPEQVVRAYADAVHARDCKTAEALVNNQRQSWCGSIDITALKVIELTQERRETGSGQGPMIERVWVTLRSQGGDISIPDGDHVELSVGPNRSKWCMAHLRPGTRLRAAGSPNGPDGASLAQDE